MNPVRSICVYCGSSPGRGEAYRAAGTSFGRALARAGLRLVYGAGTRGIMGAVAMGCIEAGGEVTGIIPRFLLKKESGGPAQDLIGELVVTENMHQRKHAMFEKSDAFVAMPGGIGTLEEIVEIMTWAQLGRHRKPMVFANIDGFWDPMLALLAHMREEGFLHSAERAEPLIASTVDEIIPLVLRASAPRAEGDGTVIERL